MKSDLQSISFFTLASSLTLRLVTKKRRKISKKNYVSIVVSILRTKINNRLLQKKLAQKMQILSPSSLKAVFKVMRNSGEKAVCNPVCNTKEGVVQ